MSLIDTLKALAITIRNEKKKEANSAIRIGDMFLSIIDYFSNYSIGIVYKGEVSNISSLPANASKGDTYKVLSEVDANGNPYYFQYDGSSWYNTKMTALPNNVVSWTDLPDDNEFYPIILDKSKGIILAIRKSDGTPYIPKLIDSLKELISLETLNPVLQSIINNGTLQVLDDDPDWLLIAKDKLGQILWGIRRDMSIYPESLTFRDIETYLNDSIIEISDDPDWLFIHRDKLGQIAWGIRKDLSIYPLDGLERRIQMLEENTSSGSNGNDHSRENVLQLPFPRSLVRIDLIGDTTGMSKDNAVPMLLRFNDMQGNYFEKNIIISWQGSSSINYPKKNYAFDLLNEDGSSFVIKFGDWVSTDSFHFKANYIDFTQARNVVSARMAHQINMEKPIGEQQPWDVVYSPANSLITDRFNTGARGVIDGFPVEIYINGVYQGLFTWNLKKHRDNYHMQKDNQQHIQCEMLATNTQFTYPVSWGSWEIRNPKGFDAGAEPPAGAVKTAFERLNQWAATVNVANFRTEAPDYLHINNLIDFYILAQVWCGIDIVIKNTQVCTWDGQKWAFILYDLDTVFGLQWDGASFLSPTLNLHSDENKILYALSRAYKTEIEARYSEIRKTFLSYDNVKNLFSDFINIIGIDAYKRDAARWTQIPSNSSVYTSLPQIMDWYKQRLVYTDNKFNYTN